MNPNIPERDERDPRPFPGHHGRQQYRFSPEELRVLKECNRESFYQRCIPISALLGVTTYYGVKAGYLRPSLRLGASPKVIVAVVVGYFVGKFSYQSRCAEKLMQLPNSQIGEMLRQRRRGNWQESLEPGFGPGMSLAPFSGMSSTDTYSDLNPNNSLDIDTSRPLSEGLNDSLRPSVDNPIYEEEMPPIQKHTTTYEELRKKNRDEYHQKRTANYREPQRSVIPSSSSQSGFDTESGQNEQPKNKYGDVWV